MVNRSLVRIMGLGMILMLMLIPVSPVLAAGFESPFPASATTVKPVERPDMTSVSSALCEVFGIECDRATMAKGVYIDPGVWEFSPQWTLIMLGSTKQRGDVLKFVDGLEASKEEKTAWRSSLEELWKEYPVRAVKTEDGLALTIVPEKSDVRLEVSENSALRELDEEIGRAMASSMDGEVGVRWNADTHGWIIKAACVHNSVNETNADIAAEHAYEPDWWYEGSEFEIILQRCYNHGYVPPSPTPPIPGVPTGFGAAPENCQKNATDAATAYYNNRLDDAFTSLGHSSHFMTDIGNPMHTGNLFVQGSLTVMGWNIHSAYENYTQDNWVALGFGELVDNTVETEVWVTPDYSTRLLGWKTQWVRDPLILLVTLNYLTHGGEFHLEESPAIREITLWTLGETTKHTNGLVYYVIKDGIRTHVITATAGPHGSISPSGDVQVLYGEEQSFTITPDSGYTVDDVAVDGESVGARTTYTFEGVDADHTIAATFKEPSAASSEWIWSRDGWDGWSHEATWSGTQTGPCSEYGPVIVDDHGEHGTNANLSAGSTTARVERQFTDASGNGWNTLTFTGLLAESDVPRGRWMIIEVNDQQVFAGTASQVPPGNGQMFEITVPFPQSDEVNVRISHGQDPAWGPRFAMQYHSLNLTLDGNQRGAAMGDTPFVLPDPASLVLNGTAGSP
ncbi:MULTISPECIES: InlB B-repeat-containing protein [Methanoculleus]|uniref:Bacterial repeat domain-containing protein n=2 Tax=Methanoculleus TaxID=45989 RepID=A3CWX0_METMJ|nr:MULTISPECIES: hypothetical protein [Methanoculleus]ABN57870.1 hypothetical protein Memar_1944 [Methanoculleus marisnigri JR1]UYU19256.1 hypothetical protein OH143_03980 [Methanoculleus submarinus]